LNEAAPTAENRNGTGVRTRGTNADKITANEQWKNAMQNAPTRTVFGVITDFLATNPTPEAIIGYRLPDDLQARAHELLELNGEGQLSDIEREEMLDFVRVDEMMSLLKAKMRLKLNKASESV
jgi:hypothetical protein